ncbi:MAG TPA: DUF4288 domain-containing protein [Pseudonocardiaceae bacterium]|nr:DUF4288 domain-containing protein [Pseudonocardiaceae bacterium]
MADRRAPYIAVLLFESTIAGVAEPPLYREDFLLVWAGSEEEARAVATRRGEQESGSAESEAGMVTLTLKHVVDVNRALDDDFAGATADLYSRHFRNYRAYQQFEPLLSGEQL